jgi:hypothetical protein
MKTILMQHEITEALEKRSGVHGLKLIRLKGYDPSWDLGGLRESPLKEGEEANLRKALTALQDEFDMA